MEPEKNRLVTTSTPQSSEKALPRATMAGRRGDELKKQKRSERRTLAEANGTEAGAGRLDRFRLVRIGDVTGASENGLQE